MTKKINAALADLIKALEKHAHVASSESDSVSKVERATAKVQRAATAYLSALPTEKHMVNPFANVVDDRMDDDLRATLAAERAQIVRREKKAPIEPKETPES